MAATAAFHTAASIQAAARIQAILDGTFTGTPEQLAEEIRNGAKALEAAGCWLRRQHAKGKLLPQPEAPATETQRVTVFGPNLHDQSKGDFHVHAAECSDCKHYGHGRKFGGEPGWTIDAPSKDDVVLDVYSDMILSNDMYDLADFVSDLHFAPCVTLPDTRDGIQAEIEAARAA
jgi:hypothetical protein